MKLVWALVLLVVGSLLFHVLSPWWFTPLASNWSTVDITTDITLYITGFVFVAVNLFMAYAIYRYRYNATRRAHYEPENKRLEIWLTVGTSVGVAAMLAPGLVVWAAFTDVPAEADQVEVLGEQWSWSYRFPGADGELGEVDARHINSDNPFGMDPTDPAGADDVLVRNVELHLPIDRPVKLNLRSRDVLHNFAVPQFRVKMDMVPGLVSHVWFTPTHTGAYDVLCMELCGIAHYAMRGKVVVDEQEDFDTWLAAQPTWDEMQGREPADPVAGSAHYATCSACHGPNGEGNVALNAPALAGLQPWYLERQLRYYREGVRGATEADTYGRQMAPMSLTLAGDAAVRNVAAYIADMPLPATAAPERGDPGEGKKYYSTCAVCHGARAEGKEALQAPRLAGQSDWYLRRQLEHFRSGVRGAHENDNYGHQMVLMARTLTAEQSVDDLLAYIDSLR